MVHRLPARLARVGGSKSWFRKEQHVHHMCSLEGPRGETPESGWKRSTLSAGRPPYSLVSMV